MTQSIRKSIVAVLAFALIASACGGSINNSNPVESEDVPEGFATAPVGSGGMAESGNTSDPVAAVGDAPNPASIDITLEEASRASLILGPEGGSFTTSDAKGTQYTLTVPNGALLSPIEISMTAIASAEGEAMGDTFLAGVDLQPNGLTFLKPVTLEMDGEAIVDGAVAFAAETGGQDLHLTPSENAAGSLSVTISHFSDAGAAEESLADMLRASVPEDDQAELDHWLAVLGDDAAALRVIEDRIDALIKIGELDDYLGWEIFTQMVIQTFHRIDDEIDRRGWDEDHPDGWEHLLERWQDLQDQWFKTSETVLGTLAEQCRNGDYTPLVGVTAIRIVATDMDKFFPRYLSGGDWQKLKDVASACYQFDITWQATITAAGSSQGEQLYSDISLFAQAGVHVEDDVIHNTPQIVELEVDYITGIWNICESRPGTMKLEHSFEIDMANLGVLAMSDTFKGFKVFVKITEPVYIDCSPAGFEIDADAQAPFHGAALERLNQDRSTFRGWEYELKYDPVGVILAQFSEFGKKFTVSGLEYELTQIVNVLKPNTDE